MDLRRYSTVLAIAAVAAVYFVVGKLSLHLAFLHASASPVWPPAGIALTVLLLFGMRLWPGIFIGAFLVNLVTKGTWWTSLAIGTGNTLEAVCAAWLVNYWADGVRVFEHYRNVFKFTLIALVSTLISPSIGLTSLALAGSATWTEYGRVWTTWWLGDATGQLVITPLTLLWCIQPRWRLRFRKDLEVALLFLLLFLLTELVFGGWFGISTKNYPVPFLCAPLLTWAAFRLSQRETATATVLLTFIATWGTLRGFGPFVVSDNNQSLLIVQSFSAVFAVTALALSAGMAERRRAQSAIEQQKFEVEAANRTKDNFLAMLSHELRTPLTPVIAALDGLESAGIQTEETKSALAMIRRNVELESQLIDDLLDLTRIARDKLQLNFTTIDSHDAISNVIEIFRNEASAGGLTVHSNLRAGAHFVSADAAKFQQIIWNLLKNAIKFTKPGGEIIVSTTNPTPQVLEISVRDTGIGMDADVMKRIFDPFEQGSQSFQTRFGGLGLGLAISKSLADAHGGTLVARSEGLNQGATFVLTMQTVSPPRQWVSIPPSAPQAHSLRILLVDDHLDTCTALERLLIRRGHLVASAHDMRSAMEIAARNQFDLLVSDIALPDGSGTELIACLRAMKPIRGIAISGFGMNGDIEKSLKAGFSAHLVKPIKVEKLEAAIDRVMAS